MSSDGAAAVAAAGLIKAGAGGGDGASKGGGVGAACGCGAEAVLAGGAAASLCTDSRTARFTLISLMLPSCWSCRNAAAHKQTIIRTGSLFKIFCALHNKTGNAARHRHRRIAGRDAAVRHASLLPFGAGSVAKQWRYRQQTSAR